MAHDRFRVSNVQIPGFFEYLSKNTIQAKILLNEATPSFRPDMSVKVTFLEKDAATSAADKTVTSP